MGRGKPDTIGKHCAGETQDFTIMEVIDNVFEKNVNTHLGLQAVGQSKFDKLLLNKSSRLPSPEEYV